MVRYASGGQSSPRASMQSGKVRATLLRSSSWRTIVPLSVACSPWNATVEHPCQGDVENGRVDGGLFAGDTHRQCFRGRILQLPDVQAPAGSQVRVIRKVLFEKFQQQRNVRILEQGAPCESISTPPSVCVMVSLPKFRLSMSFSDA